MGRVKSIRRLNKILECSFTAYELYCRRTRIENHSGEDEFANAPDKSSLKNRRMNVGTGKNGALGSIVNKVD
ncbi:hypothetical protein LEP1GSC036_2360 [Leptospira weilii str. 2006001853]|uniref:Uncharacterized protein n=1 Tax=Leptospira weilii str. 2006001853 TaxID=1001589 RepID=A0A828YZ12_9LEPT|nr:hypothetical protein LEP1GSC036_2360 [Leptospira weilii str. 2006001853]